ncbi:hypothetical protein NE462_27725, partial [Blautia hominis]|nr:hypothetical protein [Blautia hominis]
KISSVYVIIELAVSRAVCRKRKRYRGKIPRLEKENFKMKEIINFIEANVNGRTLFTEELIYK